MSSCFLLASTSFVHKSCYNGCDTPTKERRLKKTTTRFIIAPYIRATCASFIPTHFINTPSYRTVSFYDDDDDDDDYYYYYYYYYFNIIILTSW